MSDKNTAAPKAEKSKEVEIPFVRKNYLFMVGGFVLVIIGFLFMYISPEGRGKSEIIYSFSKTTLPVLIIMVGFVVTAVGIMKRFKQD